MRKHANQYSKITDEMRGQIINLWQKEMTGGEIASQLGVSRNSVIGVIYRAKQNGDILRGRKDVKKIIKKVKPIKEKIVKQADKKVKQPKIAKEEKKIEAISKPLQQTEIDKSNAVTIDQLMHYSCRFIVEVGNYETTKYCGKEKDRESYCKEHYAICYTPTRFSTQKLLNI